MYRKFFVKLSEIFLWGGVGKLILFNAESRYLVVQTTREYRAGMLQERNMSCSWCLSGIVESPEQQRL